ncbi:S-layer homology domain-containing protein [Cohnella sp. OV330]|uniref:S-layer homology domain-containing protein n=1 Tax=Cohnella sp. OV330 TaxID=1855288 RepID=UPI0008F251DF|nr:S-layer homology domain-containing protein [Cohnella sp. OV330]SFA91981.1 S-layer homology domain-containing protein [Cohnella sp. OV330]
MRSAKWRGAMAALLLLAGIGQFGLVGMANAAENATTAFELKAAQASVKVNEPFAVTIEGTGLKSLYAYEVLVDLPAGVSVVDAQDRLPGGLSAAPVLNGHTLRYGSTKTGQASGIDGALVLARLTLRSNVEGDAEIRLTSVKTLDPKLSATTFAEPRTVKVHIAASGGTTVNGGENGGGENGGGTGGDNGTDEPAAIDENDGASQLASGRIVIPTDRPVEAPLSTLLAWARQKPDAVLEIASGSATYSLPLAELASPAWLARLGEDAASARITIQAAEAGAAQTNQAERSASALGAKLLTKPVAFDVFATLPDGRTVTMDRFDAYVSRSFKLEGEVDPSRTTGVYIDPDTGELRPVPTAFRVVNGEAVADLYRQGNSVYALVALDKRFGDVTGHWSRETVETMASKLLVQGVADGRFDPDKAVTRAEFAALLARALALNAAEPTATAFADVGPNKWYAVTVQAASAAKLIQGDPDGRFRPEDPISRQELAAILMRAAEYVQRPLAEATAEAGDQAFADLQQSAAWARPAIVEAAAAGLLTGDGRQTFRPLAKTTRAEAAVVLKRLLAQAGLFGE